MKAAIYTRVSTEEQDTTNQKVQLEEFAKKSGFDYQVFEEVESSRKTRPIKEHVLNLLRNKEFDMLLIWKLDRWARSLPELSLELTELYEKNIKFVSLTDNIDLSTASGKLQFHIIAAFAEFERDLIRERTRASHKKIDGEIAKNGFYKTKAGKIIMKRGRPSGSKDKKRRKISGYLLRYANKSPP
jgi:putative DNA-invertase from lambdoid prophage Rac